MARPMLSISSMFDELSSETLRNVTGGFGVDPAMAKVMLMALQQMQATRDATLAALNDSVAQVIALLGSMSAPAPAAPPVLPLGFAPIAPMPPMPFGAP